MKYKSVLITANGGPEVLKLVESELLPPGPGQVQMRILAAGVAFTDLSMRYGMYPGVPSLPYAPGYDMVGRVTALGEGVDSFSAGQTVAALTVTGGYAEYINLPAGRLVPVPEGLDPSEVASLIQSYTTAYQLLHRVARVRAGQSVLVHGAAGGVGTALVQLARLAGLEVFGTASAAKQGYVRSLGATPVDYLHEDFVDRIHTLTGDGVAPASRVSPGGLGQGVSGVAPASRVSPGGLGQGASGVDVVFDNVGAGNLWRSRRALRRGGRLVSYGFLSSLKDGKANKLVLVKTFLSIGLMKALPGSKKTDFFDINPSARDHPDWFRKDLEALFQLLKEGKLKPHIAARFPLEQAAEAQELLESRKVTGKIVLVMG